MAVLDFLGGFSQSLGSSFLQRQQEERSKKDRNTMLTFQGLGKLFEDAKSQGDNETAADILEHMGATVGDKDYLPHFAGMIRQAKPKTIQAPTQQAEAAQANINQLSQQPDQLVGNPTSGTVKSISPLLNAERPRIATEQKVIQKGFYPTPQEQSEQQTRELVEREKFLSPIKLEEFKQQRRIIGDEQRLTKQQDYENRMKQIETSAEAKSAYGQYLNTITNGNPSGATQEQKEMASDYALKEQQAGVGRKLAQADLDKARAKEAETRHADRQARQKTYQQSVDNVAKNFTSLASYREWMKQNGNDKLLISQKQVESKYGEGKAILEKMKDYSKRMGDVVDEQKQQESIATNPLNDEPTKAAARLKVTQLEDAYNKMAGEMDKFAGQLYNPSTNSTTSSKTLTKSTTSNKLPLTKDQVQQFADANKWDYKKAYSYLKNTNRYQLP